MSKTLVTRRVDAIMSVISRCVGLVAVTVQLSNRGVAGRDGTCYLKLCLCLGCVCGAVGIAVALCLSPPRRPRPSHM